MTLPWAPNPAPRWQPVRVDGLRDYEEWHRAYDDPDSGLSWRLSTVQGLITQALESHPGPVRVLSACSGDGRDLLEVLQGRADSARVRATLLELHPGIAERARTAARATGSDIEVRTTDAGLSDSYRGAVPADLVLLVGILGNISEADIERLVMTAPQFCKPSATVLWTRGRLPEDGNDAVRAAFLAAGFTELAHVWNDIGALPAVGALRYDGQPEALVYRRLFTFLR
jgi:hypothetical protein